MRTTFLIFIFFIIHPNVNTLFGQNRLSNNARISLLTCAPGDELHSLFGHTAIRVKDSARRYDKVFNYGTFDFDTPNFMMKFIRGKLLYNLSVGDMRRFDYTYRRENRPYQEQVFNFNQEQKEKVFSYLLENARPENRDYNYDFFFDNCASRIRDVLQESLGDEVEIPKGKSDSQYQTYRQCLNYYLDGNHALGKADQQTADQESNLSGQMYLPEFLAQNLSKGKIKNAALMHHWNTRVRLTKKIIPLPWYFPTPLKVFSLLFLIMLGLFFSNKNKLNRVLHGIFFILLGLWFGTDHRACHQNLYMLWMNPFHLFLGVQLLRNKLSDFWKKYMGVALALNVLVLIGWKFLPQEFHFATIPIILTSCLSLFYYLKNKENKAFQA